MNLRSILNTSSRNITLSLLLALGATTAHVAPAMGSSAGKVGSIASMVEGLEARLKKEPDDMKSWVLLGRSYYHLQRPDDAKVAFDKAKALGYTGDLPDLTLSPAVKKEMPAGHAGYHKGTPLSDPLSQAILEVDDNKPIAVEANLSQGIQLRVDIDPELKKSLDGATAIFIFARATSGMRAPLAAVKKKVSDLPVDITLNDSMQMMPGHNISSVKEIVVGARVSISGSPMKQAGDFEAVSSAIPSSYDEKVELVIAK